MLDELDPWYTDFISRQLAAMRESPELEVPSGGSAYRLLSLPSFRAPALIRIDGRAGGWQITGKVISSLRRAESTLVWSRQRVLRQLAQELETRGFTCPHCKRHSREVRFVHGRPDVEWFFICRECGCSFTARERLESAISC